MFSSTKEIRVNSKTKAAPAGRREYIKYNIWRENVITEMVPRWCHYSNGSYSNCPQPDTLAPRREIISLLCSGPFMLGCPRLMPQTPLWETPAVWFSARQCHSLRGNRQGQPPYNSFQVIGWIRQLCKWAHHQRGSSCSVWRVPIMPPAPRQLRSVTMSSTSEGLITVTISCFAKNIYRRLMVLSHAANVVRGSFSEPLTRYMCGSV